MRYKLLESNSMMGIEKVVSEYIKQGWKPQGGIFVTYEDGRHAFYQAMIGS